MSYLLDTNLVSETIKTNPDKSVIAWLDQLPGEALYVSVLTLGEIRKGIEALSDKRRREKLRLWLEHDLTAWFEGRVLPVDLAVADRWGRLLAEAGRPLPTIEPARTSEPSSARSRSLGSSSPCSNESTRWRTRLE